MRCFVIATGWLALTMTGCSFDLVRVEAEDRSARLSIGTGVTAVGGFNFSAGFHPGLEQDGSVRALEDDDANLDGEAWPAAERRPDGTRVYVREWATAGGPEAPLRFRAPEVRAIGERPPELAVPPLHFVVPDTFAVDSAGSIDVRVEGLGRAPDWGLEVDGLLADGPQVAHWSLRVMADTVARPVIALSGTEMPPATISVSAGLLPPGLERMRVEVTLLMDRSFRSAAGGYRVRVARNARATAPLRLGPS